MLQWMGGSRRKVTASRKSTHKRQKQYFEQRKRQQQNQQQTALLESYGDAVDISEEHHREHRSLDVISLLNLSKISQECRSACPSVYPLCANTPGRKDPEVNDSKVEFHIANGSPIIQSGTVVPPYDFVEVNGPRISLDFQEETASPKKISSSAPDSHINAPNGVNSKLDNWNTTADQPLSVLDLLGDDGLNGNIEEKIKHEAHVAFSVEGLGKVGTETPVHSPQQPSRAFSYGFFSPLTAGKLNISKKFNSLLDDLEIEDTRLEEYDVPLNCNRLKFSSDYMEPLSSPKHKSFAFRDTRHYATCSSKKKSYFDLQNEDKWDDRSSFQCHGFYDERERDISWKTRRSQIDDITSENLIYRDYNSSEFTFESPRVPIRTAENVRDKFDILGQTSPFSMHEKSEYDSDFFFSNLSRYPIAERKVDCKPSKPERFTFVTEERDNSSLHSEESCSSSAVRYQATDDSLSNATSRQPKRRGQSHAFSASREKYGMKAFTNDNKDKTKEENTATGPEKCKNMLDPSRKHHPNSFFQENMERKDDWFFEERCSKVDTKPGSSSFNQSSEKKHTCFDTDIWDEDPFGKFPATKQPVGSNHSFNGFDDEPVARSPSGHFIAVKIPAHSPSRISKPELPPDSSFKRASKDSSFAAGSLGEHLSLDLPEQENISKDVESEGKFKPSEYKTYELGDEICISNESLVSEDKVATDASNSKSNNDCEGKDAKDQAVPQLMERVSTAFVPDLMEQTSTSANITDRSGSTNLEKEDHHTADKAPLPFPSGKRENVQDFGPKKRMGNQQKNDYFDSPSQAIMLQSYVFQFFCVEKRLKC